MKTLFSNNNDFQKKKVESYTFSEELKRARERLGITLAEIAEGTQIQERHLEALENGDFNLLPASVYIKGYLKSYARFLGMDEEKILNAYEKEKILQEKLKEGKIAVSKPRAEKRVRLFITPRILTVSLSLLILALFFWYLFHQISSFARAPRLIVENPSSNVAISDKTITVKGSTDHDVNLTINNQLIFVDPQGHFEEKVSLQNGLNSIVIVAKNKYGKEKKIEREILARLPEEESAVQEEVGEESPNKEVRLKITAKEEVWLKVLADGEEEFSGILMTNSSETFTAKKEISVTSGKANKTFINLNGKDLGALGSSPSPIREVKFTPTLEK